MTNLQVLELTGNILYEGSIAPWAFKPLKALKYLRLDKNRFSSIPAGLPPSLEVSFVIQPMFQSLASLYKFRDFVFAGLKVAGKSNSGGAGQASG